MVFLLLLLSVFFAPSIALFIVKNTSDLPSPSTASNGSTITWKTPGYVPAFKIGYIGFRPEHLKFMDIYIPPKSKEGCYWFGTGPFCAGECPSRFTKIRSSSWEPYEEFGSSCAVGTKDLCCSADESDCIWEGEWMASYNFNRFPCSFQMNSDETDCGKLECRDLHKQKDFVLNLKGKKCDRLRMNDWVGYGKCGRVYWWKEKKLVEVWYKRSDRNI